LWGDPKAMTDPKSDFLACIGRVAGAVSAAPTAPLDVESFATETVKSFWRGKNLARPHADVLAEALAPLAAQLASLTKRAEEAERERDGIAQLLAHVHLHMTNDEDFDCDELERDMRSLNAGKWVDTETNLNRLRATYEEARLALVTSEAEVARSREALEAVDHMRLVIASAVQHSDSAVNCDQVVAALKKVIAALAQPPEPK
jgi:hypothetical protein